jgi:hypothetical protein
MTTAEAMQLACSICFVHQPPPHISPRLSYTLRPRTPRVPHAHSPTHTRNDRIRTAELSRARPAVCISLACSPAPLPPCRLPP